MSAFGEPYIPPGSPTPAPAIVVPIYPKIKAWSYSVVTQHKKCPLAVRYQKIDRIPQPDNEYQARGQAIHKELAHLVNTGEFPEGATLPYREDWRRRLLHLHVAGARSEQQVAFNREWKVVPWYGANVWVRIVIDAILVRDDIVRVHEFKTGKYYPEHEKQKRLYALAALKLYPGHDAIVVGCDYIDQPDRADDLSKFIRAQEAGLEEEFAEFAAPLLREDVYPAAPGTHCRWCSYRKSNAGPCAFG
jgi:RecB family exonuclease